MDSIEQGILVVNLEGVIILSNKKGRDIIKVEKNDKKIIEGPLTHVEKFMNLILIILMIHLMKTLQK